MFRKKYHVTLSYDEYKMITEILIYRKNKMHQEGRFTDSIDDLLLKLLKAKVVHVKIA